MYNLMGPGHFLFWSGLGPLLIWSLIWKGIALYRAARNEQKGWFIALLIINTAGILEIIYLLISPTPGKKRK